MHIQAQVASSVITPDLGVASIQLNPRSLCIAMCTTQPLAVVQCGSQGGRVNTLTGNIDRLDGCVNFSAVVTTLITQ